MKTFNVKSLSFLFSALMLVMVSSISLSSRSYGFVSGGIQIQNSGPASWPLVVDGNTSGDAAKVQANALPVGSQDWTSMSGWKRPKVVQDRLIHWDGGFSAAEFDYQIVLLYGGAPKGFSGQYIGYASIVAREATLFKGDPEAKVSWNSRVNILAVKNIGTEAHPLAEITLELESTLTRKDVTGESTQQVRRVRYQLNGRGEVLRVASTTRSSVDTASAPRAAMGNLSGWVSPLDLLNEEVLPASSWEMSAFSCPHPINPASGVSGSSVPVGLVPLVKDNKIMETQEPVFGKALPQGVVCWNQLRGWHKETREFEYRWENSMWWDFVVQGEITWLAGATDLRGKGRYVGFVTAKVRSVSRGIVKNVNISAYAPPEMISNIGTIHNPVPAIGVVFRSEMTSGWKKEVHNWLLSVDGMGNISDLSRLP